MPSPPPTRLAGLPFPLHWTGVPLPIEVVDNSLTIATGPRSDWFVDPATGTHTRTGSALLGPVPHASFTLSARVSLDGTEPFDAGSLLVRVSDDHWAKLALELSSGGAPTIVSVVTRGRSDDATGMVVGATRAWLKVTRRSDAFAFYASTDGAHWHLVRHFHLGTGDCELGFLAQSPDGPGAVSRFDEVRYLNFVAHDLHDEEHPGSLEYVVDADLPAPREVCWRAWTDPAAFSGWFGGTPETVDLDVRGGGSWRVGEASSGDGVTPDEQLHGRYLDVVPERLLVMETSFPSGDTVMEIEFSDSESGTHVRIHQSCRSTAERDGGSQGSQMLLAACAEFVAGTGSRAPAAETPAPPTS